MDEKKRNKDRRKFSSLMRIMFSIKARVIIKIKFSNSKSITIKVHLDK